MSEWAFASAVLFGQVIVKFTTNLVSSRRHVVAERLGLVLALVVVLGLLPAMLVLALILLSEPPPTWLVVAQIVLCVTATGTYVFLGSASQQAVDEYRKRMEHHHHGQLGQGKQ